MIIILISGCYVGIMIMIMIITLTGGWYSGTVKDWFLIKGGVRVLQVVVIQKDSYP